MIILALGGCASPAKKTVPQRSLKADVSVLDRAIDRSAAYMVKNTKADGMFEYMINMDPSIRVEQEYNILRHGGAIYAMLAQYEDSPDQEMRHALLRSGRYLRLEAIGGVSGRRDMLAVWSKPEVNRKDNPLEAKLGGAGLGLVALTGIEEIEPGFTPPSELRQLGRFIVFMQRKDGSFTSKYVPEKGGRDEEWTSLYYPGEAALGLLMLYEQDHRPIWLDSAGRTLAFLARSRRGETDVPADHWALLATAKLLSFKDTELPVPRRMLVNHAIQISEAIMKDQVRSAKIAKYEGGFTDEGYVTPTATRLEGLLAARTFLPKNRKIYARVESAIRGGIDFLIRAQIKKGPYSGAFPRAVAKVKQDTPDARHFNERAEEVRIDYVQHALSAMIEYRRAFPGRAKTD